jgi:SNF2 family DNA or RNA helicase
MIASGFATYDSGDNEKVQITFASAPKLDRMIERLKALKKGEKVIIIHEFKYSGKMISDRLRKLRIKHARAYGDMKVPERRAAKKRFQNDPECNVLVMNWRVGGAALDFPFCSRMFLYESPVSARYREQCEVRIRRNNSKFNVVRYTDFVTRGSVEESVLAFVREGRDLRRGLLRGPQAKQLRLFQ